MKAFHLTTISMYGVAAHEVAEVAQRLGIADAVSRQFSQTEGASDDQAEAELELETEETTDVSDDNGVSQGPSSFLMRFLSALQGLGGTATSKELAPVLGMSRKELRASLAGSGNSKRRIVEYTKRYDAKTRLNIYSITKVGSALVKQYANKGL